MNYHFVIKGERQGPVSEDVVRAMIVTGTLGADDLCWRDGWDQWRSARSAFPELFHGNAFTASPVAPVPVPTDSDNEVYRRMYLTHEASLKGIGTLHVLGSVLMMIAGFAGLMMAISGQEEQDSLGVVLSVIFITLGFLQGRVGLWLRKVDPRAKVPATIFAGIGLLAFPLGTLFNAWVLYLLNSEKGKAVLSPEYQDVIAATPHIKYKTSAATWILLAILVVTVVVLIGLAASAG